MQPEFQLLLITAATIGVVHTLVGPDHYVPFVALARSRGWSLKGALGLTLLYGLGHVLGSVALGCVGIAMGLTVSSLETFEGARGDMAAWLLIGLGTLYMAWGIHHALRLHAHSHMYPDLHKPPGGMARWLLFLVFIVGPCEALIPVLMYPAATMGTAEVAAVTVVFAVATLVTMAAAVWVGFLGVERLRASGLERYGHALAGAVILACGVAIQLGL